MYIKTTIIAPTKEITMAELESMIEQKLIEQLAYVRTVDIHGILMQIVLMEERRELLHGYGFLVGYVYSRCH